MTADRLFLIGPRGSGKSTVAQLLAAALGWEWVDADAVLEDCCGRSIREVFATEGESGFRQHEAEVLKELCSRSKVVVATGGGVVLREDNRRLLRQSGKVVWLTADADTLWQRISRDATSAERRPALTPAGGREEMEQVLQAREPLYRSCADWIVDTSTLNAEDITQVILSHLTTDN